MILSLLGALTLLARQMNQAEDWNDTFVGQDPPQSVLIGEHRHFVGGAILTECKRYFYKENRIGWRAFCVVTVTRFRLPDGPSSDEEFKFNERDTGQWQFCP